MQPVYPPQRKAGFPLWAGILIGCGCLGAFGVIVLAAILFPVFAQARDKARSNSCMSNVRQLALSASMYEQDYDGAVPDAARWTAQVELYNNNPNILRCPALPQGSYGYAYNDTLSKSNIAKLANPSQAPMFYDSTDLSRGAHDKVTSVPVIARHNRRNSMSYADGHAKALMPGETVNARAGIDR